MHEHPCEMPGIIVKQGISPKKE
jgi:hypothetical protein